MESRHTDNGHRPGAAKSPCVDCVESCPQHRSAPGSGGRTGLAQVLPSFPSPRHRAHSVDGTGQLKLECPLGSPSGQRQQAGVLPHPSSVSGAPPHNSANSPFVELPVTPRERKRGREFLKIRVFC